MSAISNGVGSSAEVTVKRTLSGVYDEAGIRFSIDLVAAARRHLFFLRAVSESPWFHDPSTVSQAIRRYDDLWMPFISDLTVGSTPPVLVPPLDIQWVWHCHSLNPPHYRKYCESRFGKLIGKPAIFDDENEEYALNRCRDIWNQRYPSEPFQLQADTDSSPFTSITNEDILNEVTKHKSLYFKFSQPYMSEILHLIAARQRYIGLLYVLRRFRDEYSRLVPTADILLIWLTHQSYPAKYAGDVKEIEGDLGKVVGVWEAVKEEDRETTKKLWERAFDQPYEKAGATMDIHGIHSVKSPPMNWDTSDSDANRSDRSMETRFLLEVCVFLRSIPEKNETAEKKHEFLRLRIIRCHREMKIDKPISDIPGNSWGKTWKLYCEFGTRGLVLEHRRRGGGCFRSSKLVGRTAFLWNDLIRAPSLVLEKHEEQHVKAVVSITPPVQAPYLLKCVPDRVTDDSGAMISDVILRMNRYRPQEGRWLSRTVLDHAGRECFVVRIRVGGGIWRRGGEAPAAVRWEDRIVEIREGSWTYVAGSIGAAPQKVVGTATPKSESRGKKASWHLSTGDELTIEWETSSSSSSLGLTFHLENQTSLESSTKVRLLKGRKMQYQVSHRVDLDTNKESDYKENNEEDGFVTLVRFTQENPNGRATALLNWKFLVVELLPEEDAVLVLLLCMTILRSVSEISKEDIGNLLVRRRLKEAKPGSRDWGSVILHPTVSSTSSSFVSPHLQPWYWNVKAFMASDDVNQPTQQTNYSAAEGGDKLYKRSILA
ncbi:PREDICTED: glycine-rich domain-containing protein 2 isoform X2 [Nelumbo nucifera]|uniref:Glycine-rich domain-containing protein 2 isoform X2 n=1 Tax=Nelumbo nucifera TaxID=4432 RepID=A0A1U8ABI7_NELNU|nr:PREDICTED: glycine-rich domain-containing protein 2 isoform X2 [Nelumbo nucifera]